MKKVLLFTLSLIAFLGLNAQEVKWTFDSKKITDSEFELTFNANIPDGFYMYSTEKTDGPLPLVFDFDSASYQLIDSITADRASKEKFDDGFSIYVKYFEGSVSFTQKVKILAKKVNIKGSLSYQSCSEEQCMPGYSDFSFNLEGSPAKDKNGSGNSLISFFILAFFMGILGVITPCVFPMIPMTVSFFMSGSDKKRIVITKGLIFGLSVTFIYTLVGIIVALTQNDSVAIILSTHWIPNFLFFGLFVAFALSFFGVFEITLPNSLATKADKQVDNGGYLASFFLAATLAITSFSCTGPFIGTLLVQSATGGIALKPILGMFGFGLGLGLPFIIFAFTPSLIKKLPKSGGWLNSVKVVFAFVLLAMSLKFLDIVDNSFNLGLITRDVFIAIWIILSAFVGLYLLGKIKLSHDSDMPHVGIFRLLLAIAAFSFSVYLVPGLFGAPLSAVSAFMPAQEKQVFSIEPQAPIFISQENTSENKMPMFAPSLNMGNAFAAKYSDFLTLPKGISGYFDIKEGLAKAKEQNKPVLLDFKGHNCSNCKKMEKGIFTNEKLIDLLNEKFVVIGLYADDNTILPESEHVKVAGRVLKTMGEINRNYQTTTYGLNAQPYFVILDSNGNAISDGMGYETNADKFIQWLEKGLESYK